MTVTAKILVLAAVAVTEIVVLALVGRKLADPGRAPVVAVLASSAVLTIAVVGYVLFAVLE